MPVQLFNHPTLYTLYQPLGHFFLLINNVGTQLKFFLYDQTVILFLNSTLCILHLKFYIFSGIFLHFILITHFYNHRITQTIALHYFRNVTVWPQSPLGMKSIVESLCCCNHTFIYLFSNLHLRIWFREIMRKRDREREREREREKHWCKRNINRSSPTSAPTRDGAYNLGLCPDQDQTLHFLLYEMTLPPTEPQDQGLQLHFFKHCWAISFPMDHCTYLSDLSLFDH